ncbi:15056_t:CDS:2 [Racocetra fulgida]|uniref:15056_t:CDS:1 n=1 Tax=Racocetra fulgida TaxID=60492 RepID=A0A9N8W663_9GLOM|nr:15056_t:CDS:2 [Racocetra fulgida]
MNDVVAIENLATNNQYYTEMHSNSQSSQNPPLDDLGSISSYDKPVSTTNRQHYSEMQSHSEMQSTTNRHYSEMKSNSKNSHNTMSPNDVKRPIGSNYNLGLTEIKVVGFAYAHVSNPSEIIANDYWQEFTGPLKTDTVLRYDQNFKSVEAWGLPALVQKPNMRRIYKGGFSPIQFLKLHLSKKFDKPDLPEGLYYKKTITDYLTEMMDFTTFKLKNNELSENLLYKATESAGGACVDKEFLKFLEKKVGEYAVSSLAKEYNDQFQYMLSEFQRQIKLPFTGIKKDFKVIKFDIKEVCPMLKQYVTGTSKSKLERVNWIIDIGFDDVKSMFDLVIDKIIKLIGLQLNLGITYTAMFLVGGFSESKYLQMRIYQHYHNQIKNIIFLDDPVKTIYVIKLCFYLH